MDSLRPRTLTDYLQALRRRRLVIIISALVVTVASVIAIKQMPNIYESSTFIIVESPQGEGSADRSSLDLPRRLNTITQQVTSRTRLEQIISKYNLYPEALAKGARIDDVIADMRGNIRVQVNSSRAEATDAFTISYRSTNPETAQKVTAELADQLIAENVAAMQSQVSGEVDVLRQRATELAAQLRDLEQQGPWLLTLKEDALIAPAAAATVRSTGPSLEAIRAQQMSIESLKDQQYKLQQQIADLNQRISRQRQIVEQQKKSNNMPDNPTYGILIARRTELQGQRDTLINRQELTDKHPRVIAISDQIAAINRQIEEMRQQNAGMISQTAEARELAALESERNRAQVDLEVTGREMQRRVSNPPAASAPVARTVAPGPAVPRNTGGARLAQDYLGLKQTYKEVVAKLQDAELKRQTIGSAKVEQFRVLDQANLPQLPGWPNRQLLAAVALALGLALGVGFALALELRRFTSLHDAKDIEHYTRLPLLAAIPRALTDTERTTAERRAKLRLALGTALAVVATIALTKVFLITNLFALIGKK